MKILRDKMRQTEFILQREGFQLRTPRAEYSNGLQSIILVRTDGTSTTMGESQFLDVIDGKSRLPHAERDAVLAWYQHSEYRLGREAWTVEQELKMTTNSVAREQLTARLDALRKESELPQRERGRRQLSVLYDVTDDRLSRLDELIHGPMPYTIRVGGFTLSVQCTQQYENDLRSFGFFDDFKRAYEFMLRVRGEPNYSTSAQALYTEEKVSGEGRGVVHCNKNEVRLVGYLSKNGMLAERYCNVRTENGKIRADAVLRADHLLREYEIATEGDRLIGIGPANFFCDSSLHVSADPTILEKEVPAILSALWRP